MVVGRAMALAGKGVVIGGVASLVMGQVVAGMLFQVRPYDPWTFAPLPLVLTLTAVAAVGDAGAARGAGRSRWWRCAPTDPASTRSLSLSFFVVPAAAAGRCPDGAGESCRRSSRARLRRRRFRSCRSRGVRAAPRRRSWSAGCCWKSPCRSCTVNVALVVSGRIIVMSPLCVEKRYGPPAAIVPSKRMSPFTVRDLEALGVDAGQRDVSVGRFRSDVADRAGDADAFVDRAGVDAALGVLDDDLALDRLGRDEPRAALDDDVAADGFGGDLVLRAFDADVEELPLTFTGSHAGAVIS